MPVSNLRSPQSALIKEPTEYSSGIWKIPLGKVDARLLRCIINSGKGVALRDNTWTKTCATPLQGVTVDLNICSNAVTDKSGNSNHPTLSNVTLLNGEMQFNGISGGGCSSLIIPRNSSFEQLSQTFFCRLRFNTGFGVSNVRIFDKWTTSTTGGIRTYVDGSSRCIYFQAVSSVNGVTASVTSSALVANITYDLAFTIETYAGSNLGRLSIYVNGVLNAQGEESAVYAIGTSNLFIGNTSTSDRTMNGSIYAFKMFDHALSPAEVKALSDQRTALYPSQDSLNFTETQTAVKDLQWFVRNPTSTIEVNPLVLFEDDNTFWTASGSHIVASRNTDLAYVSNGIASERLAFTTVAENTNGIYHLYGSNQDWTNYDRISLRYYGTNSGNTIRVIVTNDTTADVSTGVGWYAEFIDNFSGYRIIHILLKAMTIYSGSPIWTAIRKVCVRLMNYITPTFTTYIDHVIVDVCPSIPVKKLSIDGLYLENQLEESIVATDVSQISDDAQTAIWTQGAYTVESNVSSSPSPVKGTDCMKMIVTNCPQYSSIIYSTFASQDWTSWDFLSFYWYGANTGLRISLVLDCPNGSNEYYTNGILTDNFTGWKRIVCPIRSLITFGSPVISTVTKINFRNPDATLSNGVWYLDRFTLQKGCWAFVEVAVPDILYQWQNYVDASASVYEWLYWVLQDSIGGSYVPVITYSTASAAYRYFSSGVFKFLDNGSLIQTIYGDASATRSENSFAALKIGTRYQAQTKIQNFMATQTITYNGVGGCKRRIGFAIKMPPSDLIADSTHGINQAKLRLEVYVP